ncbi:ATP-binding cassette domain-containing protein, partial [Nocardia farcinica]|uniref:ATP-binding cassette domain-containing protein n=1 Tax=Nocardia farcinica TaxID=37329 RepID=UPI002455B89E
VCLFSLLGGVRGRLIGQNSGLGGPLASGDPYPGAGGGAPIHDRILELPNGYDSVVGVDVVLSGGEAQRLSLARALLAATPVLVLDEATAFADPQTEQAVRRTLSALGGDRTLLVIAHRLETIADADTVAVLDNGTIVERGSPRELLARGGRFAALWETHRTAVADRPSREETPR